MISFIVAMDENRVIGKDNAMPWHLPADLKHFKQITKGHTIVMGRKTFEAIGRPLPDRRNIILTSSKTFNPEGCEVIQSLEKVKEIAFSNEEIIVIGGQTLFEQLLSVTDRLYVTIIHETFPGDTYFPKWDESEWEIVEERKGNLDEKNKYDHTFITLDRKHNK